MSLSYLQIKQLIQDNLPDNISQLINPAMVREVFSESLDYAKDNIDVVPTLDQVLAVGNSSVRTAYLGSLSIAGGSSGQYSLLLSNASATASRNITLPDGDGTLLIDSGIYSNPSWLTAIAQSKVTGLSSALAAKADLVGGKIPQSQLPAIAIGETFTVSSQAAMLALTAQNGDVAIRTDLSNRKFMLTGGDATVLSGWIEIGGTGNIISVNGYTGVVVLTYSSVGAAAASHTHAQSDVAGLTTALSDKASISGSYSNPSWITGLAWSKITGTPTTIAGYGITDSLSSTDMAATYVALAGSYANPSWITGLAWSKISSTPTTLSGYGITDAVPASRTITINGTAYDLSANRSWTVSGSSQWVTSGSDIYYTTGKVSIGTSTPVTGYAMNVTGKVQITDTLNMSSNNTLLWTNYLTSANKILLYDGGTTATRYGIGSNGADLNIFGYGGSGKINLGCGQDATTLISTNAAISIGTTLISINQPTKYTGPSISNTNIYTVYDGGNTTLRSGIGVAGTAGLGLFAYGGTATPTGLFMGVGYDCSNLTSSNSAIYIDTYNNALVNNRLQVFQPTTGIGTVSTSGTTVTGTGTQFTNTFKIGDTITISGTAYTISAIASDTSMTTTTLPTLSNQAYTLAGGRRFSVYGNGIVSVGSVLAVGTSSPNASAAFCVISTTSGALLPTMTATQRDAISSPASGLLASVSDANTAYQLQRYNGSAWVGVESGAWADYVGSSTIMGWSSTTGSYIRYQVAFKRMYVAFNVTGASNSTTTSFTIPYANNSGQTIYFPIVGLNASNGAIGSAQLPNGASTVTCYVYSSISSTGSYSSSGTKAVQGQFFVEI